ncbi:MAG: phosphoribosylformylglycinamidine cyclo-ligase [Desulfovibrionaceae bacterium]
MPDRSKAYADAGVNIRAADTLVSRLKAIVAETYTPGVLSDIGGFGGLFKLDMAGIQEPVLVAGTDGVGTKIKLAAAWGKHAGVGVDLVAMSVNDVLVQGAKPLFFLDYFATGALDVGVAEAVVASVAKGCKQAECALLGGETAEMPSMYAEGDYDLAGFCVGLADNARIVDGSAIRKGDVLIGLASTGVHSNGFSLVRKLVDQAGLKADDIFPGTTRKAWEVLLEPTAIYVRTVRNLMRDFDIKGMVHITGGGFYDNIPRVLPHGQHRVDARIHFGSWDMPPVFDWLRATGGLTWPEMLQIFNCGVGYVLIVSEKIADDVMQRLSGLKQKAWRIGEIVDGDESSADQVQVVFPGETC